MVAETEKEIDSLPDEGVALRCGLRSSGPDNPQVFVSDGLPGPLARPRSRLSFAGAPGGRASGQMLVACIQDCPRDRPRADRAL